VIVRTVQIATAKRLGIKYLDVTIGSGDKVFAPNWDMVRGVKGGTLSEEEYSVMYTNLMRNSYRVNRARWDRILALEEIVLGCYCKVGDFCHRHLLAYMLVKCGAVYKGEVS
jgi:hypothetical protein